MNQRAVGTREWTLGKKQAMNYCVGKAVYSTDVCSISGKKKELNLTFTVMHSV